MSGGGEPVGVDGGEVEYEFEVWQDNSLQAGGSASDYATAKSDADHYALIYGQDGPVEVRMYVKRQITAPPSAPVGVEGLVVKWKKESETLDIHPAGLAARRVCAIELERALSQQPAAVDGELVDMLAESVATELFGKPPPPGSNSLTRAMTLPSIKRALTAALAAQQGGDT